MQYKRICYIFVALLGITSAISTKPKTTDGLDPSPSQSTKTEHSSRQGISDSKNKNESGFKPSVNFGSNIADRSLNSSGSTSATSKSPQVSYHPEPIEEISDEKDGPQSVVLKLLDEKDDEDTPTSHNGDKDTEYEGRSKFPRIYYGEVSPGYPAHQDEEPKEPRHLSEKPQEEPPRYYYPKNYMNKQRDSKEKKKRFEYKHDEQRHSVPENTEPAHGNHETPEDKNYHGQDFHQDGYLPHHHTGREHDHSEHSYSDHGSENDHGHHVHGYGYGHGHHDNHEHKGHSEPGYHGHYRHGHGADVIGKALQVLIPSALFLTGVSALFPKRLHVPTNDYTNYKDQHQRHRRSINFNNPPPGFGKDFEAPASQYLEAEHRSMNNEDQSYEYDIGRYGQFPVEASPEVYSQPQNDFGGFQTSNEHSFPLEKADNYGQKIGIDEKFRRPIISRPSTPQEYDEFNYGPQTSLNFRSSDSQMENDSQDFVPSLGIHDSIQRESEALPISEPLPVVEKTQKRQKARGRQGVRSKKRSRPLPTPTEAPTIPVQDFQPIPTENTYQVVKKDNHEGQVKTAVGHKKLQDLLISLDDGKSKPEKERSLGHYDEHKELGKEVDLSPDGPVMGLITSYAQHDSESPSCQKRALCELAIKGKSPNSSKFESFLWSLATLVPEQFSRIYELEDIFKAIRGGDCGVFPCANPNLDLQA